MSKKKITNADVKTLIIAAIILVIGILFCVSLALASKIISIIIGVCILVLGLGLLCASFWERRSVIGGDAIAGGALIAFGIMFMVQGLAGIIFGFIPYFLIVLGALLIIESILLVLLKKSKNMTRFAILLVLGIVSVVLGILLFCVDGFAQYAALVFGIILILFAIYVIVITMTKKSVESGSSSSSSSKKSSSKKK